MALAPVSGGGGGATAAGDVSKIGVVYAPIQLSADKTVDGVAITFRENTYGVTATVTVSNTRYGELGWEEIAGEYAITIQQYGAYEGTVGITSVSDLNGANLLVSNLIVYVGTADGLVNVPVEVPLTSSLEASYMNEVIAAYTTAIAGLVAP